MAMVLSPIEEVRERQLVKLMQPYIELASSNVPFNTLEFRRKFFRINAHTVEALKNAWWRSYLKHAQGFLSSGKAH